MAAGSNVGQISISGNLVQWKIENFFDLPQEVETSIMSRNFTLEDKEWQLHIYPNGTKGLGSVSHFGIELFNWSDFAGFSVQLGIMKECGDKFGREKVPAYNGGSYSLWKFIPRPDFDSQRDQFVPNGTLRIFCMLRKLRHHPRADGSAEPSILASNHRYNSGMLRRGQACDATIRVEDQEYPVHKAVLRSQSRSFARIFDENPDGPVFIEDCDAAVFVQLLHFVYSGKLEDPPPTVFPGLYKAADRYELPDLKRACVDSMMSSPRVDTIIEVIQLAMAHGENNLLQCAAKFFAKNVETLLTTPQWRNFYEEDAEEANLLLIVAFRLRPYVGTGMFPVVSEVVRRILSVDSLF